MSTSLIGRLNEENFPFRFRSLVGKIPLQKDGSAQAQVLTDIVKLLGCSSAVFSSFVRDDEYLESYRFVAACPAAFCQIYATRRFFAIDQFLDYARLNSEPILASDVPAMSSGQNELLALGEKFGFVSNAVVPFHSSSGRMRMGVLYIGSDQQNYLTSEAFRIAKMYLREVAFELGEWWLAMIKAELLNGASIVDVDVQILRHIYEGYGSKDIAIMLNLSVANIDQRVSRVASRLGATSRKHAAKLAFDNGLFAGS
jgi:DNA-binding CsgD family transcriptional regulator